MNYQLVNSNICLTWTTLFVVCICWLTLQKLRILLQAVLKIQWRKTAAGLAEAYPETATYILKKKESKSGAIRLVRTACECLAKGGDDKNGCFRDFKDYFSCETESTKSGKLLVPFKGNRFNILFFQRWTCVLSCWWRNEFLQQRQHEQRQHANKQTPKSCPLWRSRASSLPCNLESPGPVLKVSYISFLTSHGKERIQSSGGKYCCIQESQWFPASCKRRPHRGFRPLSRSCPRRWILYPRLMEADDFDGETCAVQQLLFTAWHVLW